MGRPDGCQSDMREISLKLNAAGSGMLVSEHELCMSILIGVQAREYQTVVATLTIGRTEPLKYSEVRSALITAEQVYRRMNPKQTEQHGFRVDHSRRHRRGKQQARSNDTSAHSDRKPGRKIGKCFNCNRQGHFARDCRSPKQQEQANAATKQISTNSGDDEPQEFGYLATEGAKQLTPNHNGRNEVALRTTTARVMYCDSGATAHMTGNRDLLFDKRAIHPRTVTVGNGQRLSANMSGTLDLRGDDGSPLPLSNVLFVPGLSDALFSVGQFVNDGSHQIWFTTRGCRIVDMSTQETVLTGIRQDCNSMCEWSSPLVKQM